MTTALDELLLSATEVEIQASGKAPEVSIVAYTGGLMTVPGWGPIAIDLAGIDASAEQVGILADHDATLKGIVGHGRAVVANGKLLVQGTITPSTDAARQVIDLARGGFRFQASVGVTPVDYERVRAGERIEVNGRAIKTPASGFTLVRAGVLREVSIVALAADRGTSVAIAAHQMEQDMSETETITAEQIRAEALAETNRINAIRQVCGGRFGDIEAQAIEEGWDQQQTELAVLRASRPTATPFHGRREAPSKAVLEAALLAHMGCDHLAEQHLGADAAQQARDLRATNLVDLCRAALQMDGRDVPHGREGMIRAALSTYTLPVALGDAANKVLFEAYTESPATWRSFADVKSTTDFKKHVGIRPSDSGDLRQLPPGGEIKHGSVQEATYQYSVDTFAKMLSIDRRDIVNDDLTLFDDAARSLGRTAMRSLSDLVYTVLLANANSFFGAGHANYDAGSGTALSTTSLAAGIAKMLAHRDEEHRDLDIRARTLLVPPELQQTAKELLLSDFIQRSSNNLPTGNALKNSVSLEVEPRLSNSERFTGTSAQAWYLFASPQDTALVVAFLQGKQSPTVEFFGFDADPNTLAATWRVYFDYGAALLRQGETANLIAPSKIGKSWLVTDLALSLATGRPWLDTFATEAGNVLVLDNELHRETSAHRIPKVAQARQIPLVEIADCVFVDNLRGRLQDIFALNSYFQALPPGFFKIIILDALYRFLPKDTDENSNGSLTDVYNQLDRYAALLGCAFVLVHHVSKGSQTGKSLTDIGAGAGSQSRATDTHLVLRPHEQEEVVVLDAAVRSWPPIAPRCLRWTFPVWTPDDRLDPADLKPERPRRRARADGEANPRQQVTEPAWDASRFATAFVSETPVATSALVQAAMDAGLSERKATRLLKQAEAQGVIYRWRFGANHPVQYATVPPPETPP